MIDDLLSDQTHGSSYLVKQYLERIKRGSIDNDSIDKYNRQLNNQFESMAVIRNITKLLENSKNIIEEASTLLEQLNTTIPNLRNIISDIVSDDDKVLTFSHSQTVEDILRPMKIGKIYCMKSNPGGEGAKLAENLDATLVEDQKGMELIGEVNCILLGCDSYDTTHFVNKIGTRDICKRAKKEVTPVYVLTSSLKQIREIRTETLDDWFEIIPLNWVNLLNY